MSGVNKVILVGNLGSDPTLRYTPSGTAVCNFNIATTERFTNKDGEKEGRTEWHRVVIFSEGLCKVAEQYMRKGSKVYIEGQLQTRKWQGQDGQDRWTTEVVLQGFSGTLHMLDGRNGPAQGMSDNSQSDYGGYDDQGGSGGGGGGGGGRPAGGGNFDKTLDDEIPF